MKKSAEPAFTRGEVARILNVTPLTIANRERRGQYPAPDRDLNGYRRYCLNDVFNLQLLTYNHVDTRPILSVLYDKGYNSPKQCAHIIDTALDRRRGLV